MGTSQLGGNTEDVKNISDVFKTLSPKEIVDFLKTVYFTEIHRPGYRTSAKQLVDFCQRNFAGDYGKMIASYSGVSSHDPRARVETDDLVKRLGLLKEWDDKLKELSLVIEGTLVTLDYLVDRFDKEMPKPSGTVTERIPFYIIKVLRTRYVPPDVATGTEGP